MKVTGETFSFHHKRKRAEEARYQMHRNFQAKEPLPDRTLGNGKLKSTERQFIIMGNPYRVYL